MPRLSDLFIVFFRIGLFTFGGGYSMLPILQREIVEQKSWATAEDLLDYYAISQCTPGIIAVNTATLVGYRQRGVRGALMATLGVVFPSLIIITILAAVLSNFQNIPAVQQAFAGIRVAVAALIASAVIKLFRSNVLGNAGEQAAARLKKCWPSLLLCAAAFVLVAVLSISPVYAVLGAAFVGLLFFRKGDA